jgi:hypothetical protein
MFEAANVQPVLHVVAQDGTAEPEEAHEDQRFGLTPLGEAFLASYWARR